MATQSVDPRGQHRLLHPGSSTKGPHHPDYWHQHPHFETPYDMQELDVVTLAADGAAWVIVAGSDLTLRCEHTTNSAVGREGHLVLAYDGSGNALGKLGEFATAPAALQALPSLLTVAHMLYPNHLLMPKDADYPEEEAARE